MKIVALLSGGMDSTALCAKLIADGHLIKGIGFDYGQRHVKELGAAADVALALGIEHRYCDLSRLQIFLGGSSQTDPTIDVPEGHYADESMRLTVVPNRNMIMASIAAGWAVALGFDGIALAVHAGDHAVYPDCRPAFIERLESTLAFANYKPLAVYAPFVYKTKAEIAAIGAQHKAPFALTWSCYKGGDKHCGRCGTCVERREAFELADVPDPTEYEEDAAASV